MILGFTVSSCSEASPEEKIQNELHKSLYEVHDAIMPEMSTINRISRNLKKVKKNTELDSLQNAQIETALINLEKADEGMMDWMEHYKSPKKWRGEKTHEEIMSYLNTEKEKITQVKIMMENSIEAGEDLLNSLEN